MVSVIDLWLAILVAAVFVFIASSVLHMVIPIHKKDYKKIPGEASLLEAMRGQGVQRGHYMFPGCDDMKEMATPEMVEKMNQGPVGFLTVMPNGPINMGKSLIQWFIFSVLIGIFTGYIAGMALGPGADGVFRTTATIAVLGYAVSNIPDSIWKGVTWDITAKFVFDGVIYGLVTAVAFTWFWPAAA